MENLFALLFWACIILLIIGRSNPEKALFWYNGIRDKKTVYKIYGIGVLLSFIGFGIFNPKKNEATATQTASAKVIPNKIAFTILREWKPDEEQDAIGMDILIDQKDATQENVIALFSQIASSDVQKAVILVFTTKNAWEESQRGKGFTSDYKKSYIAYCIKNTTSKGLFRGANEIRWMQEVGTLASLYGQSTKL